MGTENETLDPNDDEETAEQQGDSEDTKLIKSLRRTIRAKDKELGSLRPLKETVAFHDAGLGSLSADHLTALKAVAGEDFSKENLQAKAKALGFSAESKSDESDKQQQEQIQGEVNTINQTENSINKSTAKPDNRDLVTKIREAKSQKEIMELIASEGEAHGLLVETEF
jgi:hypothetical protein